MLSGLKQVDKLSAGMKCTPVEDTTMAGEPVIRCTEDVVELEKSAPEKVGEIVKEAKPRRKRNPGHKLGSIDKSCVPEWVSLRTKNNKTVERCHCKHGRFMKNSMCPAKRG